MRRLEVEALDRSQHIQSRVCETHGVAPVQHGRVPLATVLDCECKRMHLSHQWKRLQRRSVDGPFLRPYAAASRLLSWPPLSGSEAAHIVGTTPLLFSQVSRPSWRHLSWPPL